jgi:hypothetical protein
MSQSAKRQKINSSATIKDSNPNEKEIENV